MLGNSVAEPVEPKLFSRAGAVTSYFVSMARGADKKKISYDTGVSVEKEWLELELEPQPK